MHRALPALLLLGCLIALGGCEEAFPSRLGTHLSGKPFPIGLADRYRTPGVYRDYETSHGVYIVSFGAMVVALSNECPHDGFLTHFDEVSQQFRCARCSARFDSNGLPRAPQEADESLVRRRIEPVDKSARGPDVELQVNARFGFRHEENEWSNRFSLYEFDAER